MKIRLLLVFLAIFFSCARSRGQDTTAPAARVKPAAHPISSQKQGLDAYVTDRAKIAQARTAGIAAAVKSYLSALNTARDRALQTGEDLDEANRLDKEIKRIKSFDDDADSDGEVPTDPPRGPQSKADRLVFDRARSKVDADSVKHLNDAKADYLKAINRGVQDAMKARDLNEANRLHGMATDLSAKEMTLDDAVVPPPPPAPVELIPLVKLPDDGLSGTWTPSNGGFYCKPAYPARLQFRTLPAGEYDYTVQFMRFSDRSGGDVTLLGAHKGHRFAFNIGGLNSLGDAVCGISDINGQPYYQNNSITFHTMKLANKKCTAVLHVRDDGLVGEIDGVEIVRWKTDYSDLTVKPQWDVNPDCLGVSIAKYAAMVYSAQVITVDSKSK